MDDFAKAAQMARQIKPFLRAMANAEEVISTAKGASEAISTLNTEIGKLTPKIKKLRLDKSTLEEAVSTLQEKYEGMDAEIKVRMKKANVEITGIHNKAEADHAVQLASLHGRYEGALKEHQANMDALALAEKSAMEKVGQAEKMLASLTKLGT